MNANATVEWTPVDFHPKILRTISQIFGRLVVTPAISRTEDWITSSVTFTSDIFSGGARLKKWNPLLRPIASKFLPEMCRINSHYASARRLLAPVLKERAEAAKKEGYQKPNDFMQWQQDRQRSKGETTLDFEEQSKVHLQLSLAAIHITGMATTRTVYDLAARPEYLEPLRNEVNKVLAEDDGVLTKNGITKLKLMDSIMKESQRMNPVAVGEIILIGNPRHSFQVVQPNISFP